MRITPSLFEAFLKCPVKCWLRATNEPPTGNVYAEWVKTQNESYRVAETNRLIAQMPPPASALSPPAETLKLAKWLLASDAVVRATGISRGSRGEGAPSSPSQPGQPGIDAGSGGLPEGLAVPDAEEILDFAGLAGLFAVLEELRRDLARDLAGGRLAVSLFGLFDELGIERQAHEEEWFATCISDTS
jgi:hypothetical protein